MENETLLDLNHEIWLQIRDLHHNFMGETKELKSL